VTLTDSSGNAACSYTYDSFGRTQACSAVTNPFAFAGREYDSESGLYYMRARYYDPATGRFLTPDPLNLTGRLLMAQQGQPIARAATVAPQLLNSYSYVANNPEAYRDPSGMQCGTPTAYQGLGNGFWRAVAPGGQWVQNSAGVVLGPFPPSYTLTVAPTGNLYVWAPSGNLVEISNIPGPPAQFGPMDQAVWDVENDVPGLLGSLLNGPNFPQIPQENQPDPAGQPSLTSVIQNSAAPYLNQLQSDWQNLTNGQQ
jgi:RHS repeat-associated protein